MEDFFFSNPYSSSYLPRRRSVVASPFDYFSHPYNHHHHRPLSHANFPERYPAKYPERNPANYPQRYQENYPGRYPADYPERSFAHSPVNNPARPRVVSIPVGDSMESLKVLEEEKKRRQQEREEEAAARIQRVVRGFMVRKNMGIVRRIEGEVEEIAKRIGVEEDRISREEKERIRVNEMLMRLLFRLDEVRGVREHRRKVIRRVIGLQERVDSIPNTGSCAVLDGKVDSVGIGGDCDLVLDKNGDVDESAKMKVEDSLEEKTDDTENSVEDGNSEVVLQENEDEKTSGLMQVEDDLMGHGDDSGALDESVGEEKDANVENSVEEIDSDENGAVKESDAKLGEFCEGQIADADDSVANAVLEEMCEGNEEKLSPGNKLDAGESEDKNGIREEQLMEEEESDSSFSAADDKSVNDEVDMNEPNPVTECPEEVKEEQIAEAVDCTVDKNRPKVEAEDTSKSNSEMKNVMEKVMEESERLQKLVAALCDRSAQQCSLMANLMDRVEHLEQVVQKMDKKKKKRHASNVISSSTEKKCSQKKR